MDEAPRGFSGPWRDYARLVLEESDVVRRLGGHFVICGLSGEGGTEWDCIYMSILTLAGRGHPYLNTYRWGEVSTGTYSQFATRYSELLWHPDWQGVENAEGIFDVKSGHPIWWQSHAAWRNVGERIQVVLHLITEPPAERTYQSPKTVPPRQHDVRVTFRGFQSRKQVVSVHGLTAEPQTRSLPVKIETGGAGTTAVVPEHLYWTVLLWEIGR
jgi:hypothetical protein